MGGLGGGIERSSGNTKDMKFEDNPMILTHLDPCPMSLMILEQEKNHVRSNGPAHLDGCKLHRIYNIGGEGRLDDPFRFII